MTETKFTYEQFCTHCKKNIIMEEIYLSNGEKITVCTNTKCIYHEKECKNKLRQKK
mgnify:CR=1 FL=1